MGMESFFICAIPKNIKITEKVEPLCDGGYVRNKQYEGESNISLLDVVTLLERENIKCKYFNDYYVSINNLIMYYKLDSKNNIQELSLEGCFSWFPKSLDYSIDIITLIDTQFNMQFYHDGTFFNISESGMFKRLIKNKYKDKYMHFLEYYGKLNEELPPGHFFYRTMHSPFRCLYKFFDSVTNWCRGTASSE